MAVGDSFMRRLPLQGVYTQTRDGFTDKPASPQSAVRQAPSLIRAMGILLRLCFWQAHGGSELLNKPGRVIA